MPASVSHTRKASVGHAFTYQVDYLLFSPDTAKALWFLSRNSFNIFSLYDIDHGGLRRSGRGTIWAREVFSHAGLSMSPDVVVALLTQPRFLGYWFTPISYWLALRGDDVLAVIAEVNNTFDQRHSYLCYLDDFAPIGQNDSIDAKKIFHVSPFLEATGTYRFRFDVRPGWMQIGISLRGKAAGLTAQMRGPVSRVTFAGLMSSLILRPGGPLRVLALIYWNALQLKLKGVTYRLRPEPPEDEVSS